MSLVFLLFGTLFLTATMETLPKSRKVAFMGFIVWLLLICSGVRHYAPSSSLERVVETVQSRADFGPTAAPYGDVEDRSKANIRNINMRLWLWGQTIRYLRDHPTALIIGIGHDRRRFVEEVLGLPYEGNLIHFHTAHNLFLDILTKSGIGALAPLLIFCVWVIRTAYLSIKTPGEQSLSVLGASCLLLVFWPPFILANLFGEEMFTDNLLLHWTTFLGVLCGLLGRRTNSIASPP